MSNINGRQPWESSIFSQRIRKLWTKKKSLQKLSPAVSAKKILWSWGMVAGVENNSPIICGQCIKLCEAKIEEKATNDALFFRIPGDKYGQPRDKLRPITRILKSWHICEAKLYASSPYVTACSPNEKKHADFAIPKQIAWWMIANDEKQAVDDRIIPYIRLLFCYV